MFKSNKSLLYIYLVSDFVAIILAQILSFYLRFGLKYEHLIINWYIFAFLSLTLLNITFMYFGRLYDMELKSFLSQLPKIINAFTYTVLTFFLLTFFIRSITFSRLNFAYFAVMGIIFLLTGRYISARIIKSMFIKGIGVKNLLVIGLNSNSKSIVDYLEDHREFGYRVSEYLDSSPRHNSDLKYSGNIGDFEKVVATKNVSAVLLAVNDKETVSKIIHYCEKNYIQVYMIPDIINMISNPIEIGQVSTIPLIMFKESKLSNSQLKLKRLLDIVLSVIGLVFLFPVFLIIALIMKLSSKGPVFFSHTRLGMNGQLIKVYKFRTMVMDSQEILKRLLDENPELAVEYSKDFKLKNDPRITGIGKWLRKTSFDELPQIINILKGEMSIVGPRPIVPDELEKYKDYGKVLLKTPPGLTGMWQISGRNDLDYDERINLDMYYINNWSFWLDVIIILKTIPAVLEKRGAY